MAEDLPTSSDGIEAKLSGKVGEEDERQSLMDLPTNEGKKEDEEESTLDGEFIKVEKELLIDIEESSNPHSPMVDMEETPGIVSHESGNPEATVNFMKMKEKIKELELQLEIVHGELKSSEAEKALLKTEFDLANNKLEEMNKHCKELELGQELMKNHILEAEHGYNLQLESLQKSTDLKDKELANARESFIGLSMDLDSSKKRIMILEEELLSSVSELHKLEELNKHRTSEAELGSRKVLELEKALELAHVNAKDMEDQISNLQKELKEFDGQIEEKQQIEEALQRTLLELPISEENLEISKSPAAELEQKIASKDAFIAKLTEELNHHKVSQEKLEEHVAELENMLSASKEDMKSKLLDLEKLGIKLQEQIKDKEAVEACFKNQELQISSLRNDLSDLNREKVMLESTVTNLNAKLLENEELRSQLEAKIILADQDFQRTDSLLSQALSYKEELQKKLELLEKFHQESKIATETSSSRNLELEGLVQASVAAEESSRAQVKESEIRFTFMEKRNMELEQQINLAEIKCLDAENEINELNEKITELTSSLKALDEENALLRRRFKNYEDRIDQLESSLNNSSSRNSELEKELNDLLKTCVEHEEQATATHHHTLELEDLIQSSHSRADDAEKRVKELELLLENANYRTQELEQLLNTTEAKHRDAESKLQQYSSKVSELAAEIESCQERSVTLEAMLLVANEKERELTDTLNAATEERKIFEDLSNSQETKIQEFENQIQDLKNELKYLRDKKESDEEELEASSVREKELVEKIRYSGEQLEHHKKAVEEITARHFELSSLHESLVKDSEVKILEAMTSLKYKESEANEVLEKLKSLEKELEFYKTQSLEATENATLLEAELRANAMKQVSLENNVEELKQKVFEATQIGEQTVAENEVLATSNSNLRKELETHQHKVNELNDLLKSIHDEKEANAKEKEAQLHEAIEKHKQRDFEARQLHEELLALETRLRSYEEQANESNVVAATQNSKLEETLIKLQDSEGLVEQLKDEYNHLKSKNEALARHNLSLSEELTANETKTNQLQVAFDAAVTEKEDILMQLHSSKKEIMDLMQLHNSDREKLRSQITSAMEDKNLHLEMYQKAKGELEAAVVQMEGRISEQKERELSLSYIVESLKAEVSEKSLFQAQISELEQKLRYANEQLEIQRKAVEEVTTRNLELNSLNEYLVKDSELKLQEAAASYKQKEFEVIELLEKLKSLEEQLTCYKEQALEATENVALIEEELAANATKVVFLENNVQELKQKVLDANLKCKQTLSENDLLEASNSKLRKELETHQHKINEHNELLKSIHSEKEATVEKLASHANTIAMLTEEHSRALDLQSTTESRLRENEAQLHEAMEKHKQRDSEARELHEKLLALEAQLRDNEKQANDSAVVSAIHKDNLEEAFLKIQDLEGLVEQLESKLDQCKTENNILVSHNLSLSEDLTTYDIKMNELQVAFDAVFTETVKISMQLHCCKQEMKEHMQILLSDKEKLQSQIASIMEERNMHNEMYLKEKNVYEGTIVQLEEKLREEEGRKLSLESIMGSLHAMLSEKSLVIAEMEQKLRYAEEQLEHQRKAMEEITRRHMDLNSLNESLAKDFELKLQEAAASFKQKELECTELLEKLNVLQEQLALYKEQAAEATENVALLKMELELNVMRVVLLENNVDDLEQKVSEANLRGEQTLAENDLLATLNSKLKEELEVYECKVNELNELLKSLHAEKEATEEQLASHAITIEKLTDEHSRGLEIQSTTEFRLKENEAQLHETIEKLKLRDLEAKQVNKKLLALESQMGIYEKQAIESADVAVTHKGKLEDALSRIQDLEGLVEQLKAESGQLQIESDSLTRHNGSLFEEIAAYETKVNNLQSAFEAAVTEKEDISMQLLCSKKEIEDLMQLLDSDKEKFQLQITSVMEEKNILNEMYQNARKELDATMVQLEEKLNEQKENELSVSSLVENLKAELSMKSAMQAELEQNLRFSGEQLEDLKKAMEDLNARNMELNSLYEYLVKDSESKLKEASESFKQKESEATELHERLNSLEKQVTFYKEQALEAKGNVSSLEAELAENAMKVNSLENNVEELKHKVSDTDLKAEQTLAENEMLATLNSNLYGELEVHRHKVNDLNELLQSIHVEKEATVEQLTSHANTIANLTEEYTRGLELYSTTESLLKENEAKLHGAIEELKERDLEARELHEKLLTLESQLRTYEKQASESAVEAATEKRKLEVADSKIQDLEGLMEILENESLQFKTESEGLTRHNLSLSEKLLTYETKLNELQVAFDAAVKEKVDISMQFYSSKKEMEDLIELLTSDKEELQFQVTSVMEENIMLNEMYQNTRKELETTTAHLENKLKEQKTWELSLNSLVENLKAELSEKSLLQEELGQKLRYGEEQLENQTKAVAEFTSRNLELNSLNESLIRDSELKLQGSAAGFKQKESENTELIEKFNYLEEQLRFYKEQVQEATENVALLEAELASNSMKVISLENNVMELKQKVSQSNFRLEQTLAENEILATSNSKLIVELEVYQDKVNQLNELFKSIHAEKEATIEQLTSDVAKLTDEHSRGLELHSITKSRLKENEAQLYEAIEKHNQRDLEFRELHEKLLALETQLSTYEKQAIESVVFTANLMGKLKEALLKIQDLEVLLEEFKTKSDQFKTENESLIRHNVNLSEELIAYETKINNLQIAFDAALVEKEDMSMQFCSSKKDMEDLIQLLKSDIEKLQSQVTSVMYENHKARNEFEATIVQLEEKLGEQKAKEFSLGSLVESLKAELSEKSIMHKELAQKLRYAQEQAEHHRNSVSEFTTRSMELSSLNESLIKDSELKLKEASDRFEQKESEAKELREKLNSLEEELMSYKEQALEATENVSFLEAELATNAMKIVSLEKNIEELKQKVSEANLISEQTLAESESLATSNSKLNEELEVHQHKVNELNEFLKSIHAEKEAAVHELNTQANTLAKLTEEHTRHLELHSTTESLLRKNEAQLQEANEKLKQRDLEARELHEKLLTLQNQLREYEKQASESAIATATEKGKLDEAVIKIEYLEGFVEQLKTECHQLKIDNAGLTTNNLSLSEELVTYDTKTNELQLALNAAVMVKDDIFMQFCSSRKEMEDLIQLLKSDKEKLQLQVTSVMEENLLLSERYEKARKELESTIVQLEEKLGECKARECSLDSLVESLQAELTEKSLMHEKLTEKFKYAQEQVEHHKNSALEFTARNLELDSLNESLIKDSELKLLEAAKSFKQKEYEAIELIEKINSLDEQLTFYKEKALDATQNVALLEADLAVNGEKVVSLENNVEELKQEVSRANLKAEQTFSENELLATSNSKLNEDLEAHKHKVNELNELLKSIHAEKETTVEQLTSHANTIAMLTNEHSRSLELHSTTESLLKENEAQLQEATEKLKQRDLEARELNENLFTLEIQLREYEKQASEFAVAAATDKGKLEEAVIKIEYLEGLVEQLKTERHQLRVDSEGLTRHNLSLSEELVTYKTKTNELQVALDSAVTEKDDICMQFCSSKKEMEDLIQLLKSDKEELSSQVTSVMEGNIMLNERYEKAREELEATIIQLEEELSVRKAREFSLDSLVESLKVELSEKSIMHEELAQKLRYSQEQAEHHRNSVSEFTTRNMELSSINESLIKDSELKLKEASDGFEQKESEAKELREKLNSLEEELMFYKQQALEATENVSSLEAELATNAMKIVSLEKNIEELKQKVSESNLISEQTLAENESLATSNSKLNEELEVHQHKVNELNEFLKSIHAEKEAAVHELNTQANTLAKLTEEHTRRLELHSTTETLLKENEAQLCDAIEKLKQRDEEATELNEKVLALETQLREYEKQVSESAVVAATEKRKLEDAIIKIQDLEGLVQHLNAECQEFKNENEGLTRHNLSLSEELVTSETKANELQVAFDAVVTEKDDIFMKFCSLKKETEDLIQLLKSDKEELLSQVTSIMEENILLNERYEMTRKELESTIVQLEEKLSEHKARESSLDSLVERLQAELTEKSIMHEELAQKLQSAEEQVQHHINSASEFSARNLELCSLNESLIKDSELKLQEASENFKLKELEVIELLKKVNSLQEELAFYKGQALEATENIAILEKELAANATRVVSLENNAEELKEKLSEANLKGEETLAENEFLASSILKLNEDLEAYHHKVNELNELLKSIHAEKEATVKKLASHANTITKLTEEHSRGMALHYATESSLKQNEAQLQQAIDKLKQRDSEASELRENLLALESQLRSYELRAIESVVISETQKGKLEEAVSKIQDLEGVVEQLKTSYDQVKTENESLTRDILILSEELVTYETKINELQVSFDTAVTDKEDMSLQFHSSKKEMEDLMQLLKSEKEKLQSEVASIMEENIMLNQIYQTARKELEATIVQLEVNISEQKMREFSLTSVVESLKKELNEEYLLQEELGQELRDAEEQLDHLRKSLAEVTAKNLELSLLNESLINDSKLKLQDAATNFKQKEFEVKELLEKLKSLEEPLTIYREQAVEASERVILLEAELGANAMKLVTVENIVEELKQKNLDTNLRCKNSLAENEVLAASNSKLKEELVAHQHKINELDELIKSIHDEKEAAVEQLASHTGTIAKLTDQQSRGLELHFATESLLKENEAQLHEAIKQHNQKDLETKELQQKLISLETKLITYQELASESALVAATRKGKLEEAVLRIQDLEGLVNQLQSMLDKLKTENEGLTRHNISLSEELKTYETKMNELQVSFDKAITDKADISMQLHSSNKEMEDILQLLNSDNEKLRSQITSSMEEYIMVNEMFQKARKELEETIVQLEEKLSEQKAREFSLNSLVENLKAELSEKSLMQAQILELKQKILLAEENYTKEIESLILAAAEKDAILSANLTEHTILIQERDALDQQLKEVLKELDSAQRTIMKQKKVDSTKEFERQVSMDLSLDALEAKNQSTILLEKQVVELKKNLLEAKIQYKEKIVKEGKKIRLLNAELKELRLKLSKATEMEMKIIKLENALQLAYAASAQVVKHDTSSSEVKVEMELKSRDIGFDVSALLERKLKNRSNKMHQDIVGTQESQNVHADLEPSLAMAFKFIWGVALVSIVMGILLGKRY